MAVLVISLAAVPRDTTAQAAGQIAAWDGLTFSPVGALAPLARAPGELPADGIDFSIRYGRWRYDPDDAVHDAFALTWARGFAFLKTRLEITGGYGLVECPTCSGSVLGGIDLESQLWEHGAVDGDAVRTGMSVRLSLGGASNLAAERSTAGSTAIAVPLDVALPLWRGTLVSIAVLPGFGYGHIANADFGNGGLLPMIGAAVSLRAGPRVGMHVGMQRVVISGGPTLIGAALSWRLR